MESAEGRGPHACPFPTPRPAPGPAQGFANIHSKEPARHPDPPWRGHGTGNSGLPRPSQPPPSDLPPPLIPVPPTDHGGTSPAGHRKHEDNAQGRGTSALLRPRASGGPQARDSAEHGGQCEAHTGLFHTEKPRVHEVQESRAAAATPGGELGTGAREAGVGLARAHGTLSCPGDHLGGQAQSNEPPGPGSRELTSLPGGPLWPEQFPPRPGTGPLGYKHLQGRGPLICLQQPTWAGLAYSRCSVNTLN